MHVYPTIRGPSFTGLICVYRFVFAQSDQVNLVSGNAMLRRQILDYCVGTTLAKLVVVVRAPD
jgi:hypothetical protein